MSNGKYDALLKPLKIGNVELKNRYIMGPMGMGWHNDPKTGAYTQEAVDYYATRAKGGFSAIITGVQLADSKVDPSMGAPTPLQNKEEYVKQARKLTEACAEYGTKVFLEIGFGVGRNYPTFKAPSALPAFNYPTMISKPLTREEIRLKRDQVIDTAVLAKEAGFAGVDIHTLHWGYLLDQFVLGITNHRTDEYGGSLENRLRLLKETVDGIHAKCGDDFPVLVGLGVKSYIKGLNKASLTGEDEAGRTVEESVEIAKLLEKIGIAAILCDVGVYDSFYYACPPSYMPKGHAVELYKQIKDAVNIPILARSRLGDPDLNADILAKGQADAIMLSRPSLADPDYPNKVAAGEIEKIRPCIGCNMACIGRCTELMTHESCAVNPRAGFETAHPEKKSVNPRKIAVVGGGMIGCETAVDLAMKGKKVAIVEQLPAILSSDFVPQQHKMMLKDMIEHYGVEVYAGYGITEITDNSAVITAARKMVTLDHKGVASNINAGDRIELDADKVVICVGLKPVENITKELSDMGVQVIEVGSANHAGNVVDATHEAYEAVYALD